MQREIFHRVGNNLQIIQSILRLYAKEAQTQEARQLIDQVAARIRVINLVHNAVHRSVDAPVLSAGQTVSKLIQGLQHEGLIASDIDIDQRFQDVGLRVSQIYALCYLLVEKLTRLSRSGASRIQIDLVEDDATIVLSVSANVGQLAAADPVRARLREVYTRDLRATARWHTETDTVTFTAVIPGQVT
nr:histidine kinase dimerization/phosphoacceptor domain -containing protein [Aliiroseovarius sp. S2029]